MSTISKLDPSVRLARYGRKGMDRYARQQLLQAHDNLDQEFHVKMSMVLNELKHDSRRTGAAKERVLRVMLKKFGEILTAAKVARDTKKDKFIQASTPLVGI
jgi:hypothetical protein